MASLSPLFYSCSAKLTETETLKINKVRGKRVAVKRLIKRIYRKGKIVVINTTLSIVILTSSPKNAVSIGVPMPVRPPIMRHSTEVVSNYAELNVEKQEKLIFVNNEEVFQTYEIYFDLLANRITTVEEIVKLRGGDRHWVIQMLYNGLLVFAAIQAHMVEGFQMNPHLNNVGPGIGTRTPPKLQENLVERNRPGQRHCTSNQNNQDGTLTKEQRRNLPSPNDIFIPEQNVYIREGQARYKVRKHGHHFGIESRKNSRVFSITQKTRENIDKFMEAIKNLVVNGKRIEGTYRAGEVDGYAAIHFYDEKNGFNAIFKKQSNEFVSAWRLEQRQATDLLTNGNVGDF